MQKAQEEPALGVIGGETIGVVNVGNRHTCSTLAICTGISMNAITVIGWPKRVISLSAVVVE